MNTTNTTKCSPVIPASKLKKVRKKLNFSGCNYGSGNFSMQYDSFVQRSAVSTIDIEKIKRKLDFSTINSGEKIRKKVCPSVPTERNLRYFEGQPRAAVSEGHRLSNAPSCRSVKRRLFDGHVECDKNRLSRAPNNNNLITLSLNKNIGGALNVSNRTNLLVNLGFSMYSIGDNSCTGSVLRDAKKFNRTNRKRDFITLDKSGSRSPVFECNALRRKLKVDDEEVKEDAGTLSRAPDAQDDGTCLSVDKSVLLENIEKPLQSKRPSFMQELYDSRASANVVAKNSQLKSPTFNRLSVVGLKQQSTNGFKTKTSAWPSSSPVIASKQRQRLVYDAKRILRENSNELERLVKNSRMRSSMTDKIKRMIDLQNNNNSADDTENRPSPVKNSLATETELQLSPLLKTNLRKKNCTISVDQKLYSKQVPESSEGDQLNRSPVLKSVAKYRVTKNSLSISSENSAVELFHLSPRLGIKKRPLLTDKLNLLNVTANCWTEKRSRSPDFSLVKKPRKLITRNNKSRLSINQESSKVNKSISSLTGFQKISKRECDDDNEPFLRNHLERFLNDCIVTQKSNLLANNSFDDALIEATTDAKNIPSNDVVEAENLVIDEVALLSSSDTIALNIDNAVSSFDGVDCNVNDDGSPVLSSKCKSIKRNCFNPFERQNLPVQNDVENHENRIESKRTNKTAANGYVIDDSSDDDQSMEIAGDPIISANTIEDESKILEIDNVDRNISEDACLPVKSNETYDSAEKNRKRKTISSDLSFRLRSLINRHKSDVNIWQYETLKSNTNDLLRTDDNLYEIPGIFYICNHWKEFSNLMLLCVPIWNSSDISDGKYIDNIRNDSVSEQLKNRVLVIVNENSYSWLKTCSVIRIYPPWHMFYSSGLNVMVMLNTYKIRKISDKNLLAGPKCARLCSLSQCRNARIIGSEVNQSIMKILIQNDYYHYNIQNEVNALKTYTSEMLADLKGTINECIYVQMLCPVNSLQINLSVCSVSRMFSVKNDNVWLIFGYDMFRKLCCLVIKNKSKQLTDLNLAMSKDRKFLFNGVIPKNRLTWRTAVEMKHWLTSLNCNATQFEMLQKEIFVFQMSEKYGFIVQSLKR